MTTCESIFNFSIILVFYHLDIITANDNATTLGGIISNLLYLL